MHTTCTAMPRGNVSQDTHNNTIIMMHMHVLFSPSFIAFRNESVMIEANIQLFSVAHIDALADNTKSQ